MRAWLIAAAGLAALVCASPAAAGAGRLDVLAEELRERPLAIDSELAWFFDAAEERRLVRALRRSPVHFRVAVLPQLEDDESGGDGHRIVAALYARLRRPGIYLVIDEHGFFDVGLYAVPREIFIPFEHKAPPSDPRRSVSADVVARVQRIAADVAAAPPGQTTDTPYPRPLEAYENWRLRRHGETTSDAALDAAVAGGVLGLFAGGLARLRARRADATAPRSSRRRRRGRSR